MCELVRFRRQRNGVTVESRDRCAAWTTNPDSPLCNECVEAKHEQPSYQDVMRMLREDTLE